MQFTNSESFCLSRAWLSSFAHFHDAVGGHWFLHKFLHDLYVCKIIIFELEFLMCLLCCVAYCMVCGCKCRLTCMLTRSDFPVHTSIVEAAAASPISGEELTNAGISEGSTKPTQQTPTTKCFFHRPASGFLRPSGVSTSSKMHALKRGATPPPPSNLEGPPPPPARSASFSAIGRTHARSPSPSGTGLSLGGRRRSESWLDWRKGVPARVSIPQNFQSKIPMASVTKPKSKSRRSPPPPPIPSRIPILQKPTRRKSDDIGSKESLDAQPAASEDKPHGNHGNRTVVLFSPVFESADEICKKIEG